MQIELKLFEKARKVLSEVISPTPLVYNEWLSDKYECNVYLKLENMLPIGSFKMRGATFKISQLSAAERKRGVLAVSAGNHAQGVAWAARRFGIEATIIMPEGSPLTKIKNTERLGARVILHGSSIEECFAHAEVVMKKENQVFIHPFNDPMVIAGQGTVAYELLEQMDKIDFIFSSIGGGGLVSGLGQVMKGKNQKTKIFAGQATGCSAMVDSLQSGKIKSIEKAETFADGIRVKKVAPEMFDILKDVVDSSHRVSDEKMAWAILQLMEKARIIAEGAGALPLGLLDQVWIKNPKLIKGKNIVLVICGGNIDVNLLERIIDRGLIESHRKVRIRVPISDRPGTLHHLTKIIKDASANILQVVHDRDSRNTGISGAIVEFTLETKGQEHLKVLIKALKKDFPYCEIMK